MERGIILITMALLVAFISTILICKDKIKVGIYDLILLWCSTTLLVGVASMVISFFRF